jgi:hypothetical protein
MTEKRGFLVCATIWVHALFPKNFITPQNQTIKICQGTKLRDYLINSLIL